MASYDEVMEALRRADAAGATEDARALAKMAADMRPQSLEQPQGEEPTFNHRALPGGPRGIRQEPVTGPSRAMMRGALGAVRGGMDMMEGGAQLGLNAASATLPPGLEALGMPENATAVGEFLRRAIAEEDALRRSNEGYYQKNWREGVQGTDYGRLAGNVAASVPVAAAFPPSLMGAIGAGAATSAMMPTEAKDTADYWSQKGKDVAIGAGTAGATNLALQGIARVISPKASRGGSAKELYDAGVELTPGQAAGGAAQRIEDAAESFPIVGDLVKGAKRRGLESLQKTAINKTLAPIGEKLDDATPIGTQAIAEMGDKIGRAYDDILPKLKLKQDPQFAADMTRLNSLARFMPEAQRNQFDDILKNEISRRFNSQTGTMSGEEFKAIERTLRPKIDRYVKSAVASEAELGSALKESLDTLRRLAMRSSPDHAARLKAINTAYAMEERVRNAAGSIGAGNKEGFFSGAQLNAAVRAADPSKGKRAFARGRALMQDLSAPAAAVMGATVPDSGTAMRGLTNYLMASGGAGLAINPTTGAIMALGALPYTAAGQRLASGAMLARPQFAQPLAEGISAIAPYAGAGAGGIAGRGLFDLLP